MTRPQEWMHDQRKKAGLPQQSRSRAGYVKGSDPFSMGGWFAAGILHRSLPRGSVWRGGREHAVNARRHSQGAWHRLAHLICGNSPRKRPSACGGSTSAIKAAQMALMSPPRQTPRASTTSGARPPSRAKVHEPCRGPDRPRGLARRQAHRPIVETRSDLVVSPGSAQKAGLPQQSRSRAGYEKGSDPFSRSIRS